MEKSIKEEQLFKFKGNMPKYFQFFKNDLEKFLDGKLSFEYMKNEVSQLLLDMEISSSPAFQSEIFMAREETNYMIQLILEID